MSRVGKNPIPLPSGVSVEIAGREVSVKGQRGALSATLAPEVSVSLEDGKIVVRPRDESKRSRQMWGLSRSLLNNMVKGVSEGFTVNLEIVGVGHRASVSGRTLTLELGYSHSIKYEIPEGVEIRCERPTLINVSGAARRQVGQVAAEIRAFKRPEPYKGKGVKYADEMIRRKEGKKK